ncbi:MAG: PAS domain-containing protein [Candidatus Competibacteraceae bacterium]|nr:PAS domain-containing protein [Candidatus Competibacteraceae bacterium]
MSKMRLSIRLLIGVLLVQVLALGLVTLNGVRLIREDRALLLDDQLRMETALAAEALVTPLARKDRDALIHVLEQLRSPMLRYAVIYNSRAHSVAALGGEAPALQSIDVPDDYRVRLTDGVLVAERIIGDHQGLLQVGYGLAAVRGTFQRFWIQSTLIALAGLAVAGGAVLFTGLSLRRDLERLAHSARALREDHLEQRLELLHIPGSLGQAATELDALADHLEHNRQQLRNRNEKLIQEARRLKGLLHGINAVVWELDSTTGCFRYVSAEAERLLGYPARQWLQPDFINATVHPGDLARVRGFLSQPGQFAGSLSLDLRMRRQSSDYLWLRLIGSVELRERSPALAGLLLDITEEKHSEQRISWLADHDHLTTLINRRRFQERLD